MENGKWKMKEVFLFSIFRFPFSVFRCFRAGFRLVCLAPKLLKISDFWCKAF
jgi:hypothetical protein